MIVTILDYNSSCVKIITIPDSETVQEVEKYLTDELDYNLDEISYMVSDKIQINADIIYGK